MSTLRLAVIGDSIAYGTGAARAADTLGPRLVAALEAAGVRAEHRVFAVPGAVSADLAVQDLIGFEVSEFELSWPNGRRGDTQPLLSAIAPLLSAVTVN